MQINRCVGRRLERVMWLVFQGVKRKVPCADGRLAERGQRQDLRGVHRDAVPGPPGRHAAPGARAAGVLHARAARARRRRAAAGDGVRHRALCLLHQGAQYRHCNTTSVESPPRAFWATVPKKTQLWLRHRFLAGGRAFDHDSRSGAGSCRACAHVQVRGLARRTTGRRWA